MLRVFRSRPKKLIPFRRLSSVQPEIKQSTSAVDQSHRKLVEALQQIPLKIEEINAKARRDMDMYADDARSAASQGGMFICQIKMEEEQHSDAVLTFDKYTKQLMNMGKGTGLKFIQKIMLSWYEPLTQEIEKEIQLIQNKAPGKDRTHYGPCLLLQPPDKLAVITLSAALNHVLKSGNSGENVTHLARYIGELVEAEVWITKLQQGKSNIPAWQHQLIKDNATSLHKRGTSLYARIGKLVDQEEWSSETLVKIGGALLSLLLRTAKTEAGTPAFLHATGFFTSSNKRAGTIRLDSGVFKQLSERDMQFVMPRYLPMLIPPKRWDNKKKKFGCYFRLKAKLMRSFSQGQHEALSRANMPKVLESLNFLGEIPWRVNGAVLNVAKEAWARGIMVGELPSQTDLDPPREEDFFRVPNKKTLSNDPKRRQHQEENPQPPDTDKAYWETPRFDQKYFDEMCRRINVKNAELHSLRCNMQLKIWVADKFVEDRFFYPYSVDFRGRAYPVPQNLNHLGSDFCRGVLWFDEAKELGPRGLHWLKVHLANLFGFNKIAHCDREKWTDSNMEEIFDSADRPLEGRRWWATAEEPFQALATCIEIAAATRSGDPVHFMSRLPVHQDGSCNGLQHYAALGRDELGAKAVNLTPNESPQDVYSRVLDIVLQKIEADSRIAPDEENIVLQNNGKCARMIRGIVNRKVIKQTVMTSVYGVTKPGARLQVQARLEERMILDPTAVTNPDTDKEIYMAARYVANLTLDSLREMFVSAKGIMDWLGHCAQLVSSQGQVVSWITPMGLPVIQPYRKPATHTVRTMLQSITLAVNDDALPVYGQKQRSAFPPNFVHSLDASHMLMTALKMKEKNITFAAVHDSYWTHPCHIEEMGESLRECFVELYEQPILEALRDSLTMRYPDVEFPLVPARGSLDVSLVRKSQYFFH